MLIILKIPVAIIMVIAIIFIISPLIRPYIEKRVNKIEVKTDEKSSQEAQDLHSTLFIADLHADPLFSYRNLLQRHSTGHTDIPRLIEGNIRLQVFGVPTFVPLFPNINRNSSKWELTGFLAFLQHWPIKTWFCQKNRAFYQAEKLHWLEAKSNGKLTVIRTSRDLEVYRQRAQMEPGITAGILMLEGAHIIQKIPDDLEELYESGFRIISLTHFTDNQLGGSAHGMKKDGLTELGRKAVQQMEALQMIIDLSHASPALMDEVLEITCRPVMVSHTGVKGCLNNSRNLSDEQLKAVASKGGLIGIGFWEEAVGKEGVKSIVASINYASQLVGIEHIALGSDFDGGVTMPFDATGMVHITEELMRQGFSEKEIRMIMGENALNFLINNLPKN